MCFSLKRIIWHKINFFLATTQSEIDNNINSTSLASLQLVVSVSPPILSLISCHRQTGTMRDTLTTLYFCYHKLQTCGSGGPGSVISDAGVSMLELLIEARK